MLSQLAPRPLCGEAFRQPNSAEEGLHRESPFVQLLPHKEALAALGRCRVLVESKGKEGLPLDGAGLRFLAALLGTALVGRLLLLQVCR